MSVIFSGRSRPAITVGYDNPRFSREPDIGFVLAAAERCGSFSICNLHRCYAGDAAKWPPPEEGVKNAT